MSNSNRREAMTMKIDDLIHEPERIEWDKDEAEFEIIREDEFGQRI